MFKLLLNPVYFTFKKVKKSKMHLHNFYYKKFTKKYGNHLVSSAQKSYLNQTLVKLKLAKRETFKGLKQIKYYERLNKHRTNNKQTKLAYRLRHFSKTLLCYRSRVKILKLFRPGFIGYPILKKRIYLQFFFKGLLSANKWFKKLLFIPRRLTRFFSPVFQINKRFYKVFDKIMVRARWKKRLKPSIRFDKKILLVKRKNYYNFFYDLNKYKLNFFFFKNYRCGLQRKLKNLFWELHRTKLHAFFTQQTGPLGAQGSNKLFKWSYNLNRRSSPNAFSSPSPRWFFVKNTYLFDLIIKKNNILFISKLYSAVSTGIASNLVLFNSFNWNNWVISTLFESFALSLEQFLVMLKLFTFKKRRLGNIKYAYKRFLYILKKLDARNTHKKKALISNDKNLSDYGDIYLKKKLKKRWTVDTAQLKYFFYKKNIRKNYKRKFFSKIKNKRFKKVSARRISMCNILIKIKKSLKSYYKRLAKNKKINFLKNYKSIFYSNKINPTPASLIFFKTHVIRYALPSIRKKKLKTLDFTTQPLLFSRLHLQLPKFFVKRLHLRKKRNRKRKKISLHKYRLIRFFSFRRRKHSFLWRKRKFRAYLVKRGYKNKPTLYKKKRFFLKSLLRNFNSLFKRNSFTIKHVTKLVSTFNNKLFSVFLRKKRKLKKLCYGLFLFINLPFSKNSFSVTPMLGSNSHIFFLYNISHQRFTSFYYYRSEHQFYFFNFFSIFRINFKNIYNSVFSQASLLVKKKTSKYKLYHWRFHFWNNLNYLPNTIQKKKYRVWRYRTLFKYKINARLEKIQLLKIKLKKLKKFYLSLKNFLLSYSIEVKTIINKMIKNVKTNLIQGQSVHYLSKIKNKICVLNRSLLLKKKKILILKLKLSRVNKKVFKWKHKACRFKKYDSLFSSKRKFRKLKAKNLNFWFLNTKKYTSSNFLKFLTAVRHTCYWPSKYGFFKFYLLSLKKTSRRRLRNLKMLKRLKILKQNSLCVQSNFSFKKNKIQKWVKRIYLKKRIKSKRKQKRIKNLDKHFLKILWNSRNVFKSSLPRKKRWTAKKFTYFFNSWYKKNKASNKNPSYTLWFLLLKNNVVKTKNELVNLLWLKLILVNGAAPVSVHSRLFVNDIVSYPIKYYLLGKAKKKLVKKSLSKVLKWKRIRWLNRNSQWRDMKKSTPKKIVNLAFNNKYMGCELQHDRYTSCLMVAKKNTSANSLQFLHSRHNLEKLNTWRFRF